MVFWFSIIPSILKLQFLLYFSSVYSIILCVSFLSILLCLSPVPSLFLCAPVSPFFPAVSKFLTHHQCVCVPFVFTASVFPPHVFSACFGFCFSFFGFVSAEIKGFPFFIQSAWESVFGSSSSDT